jgi:glycosyltransferase involved in cell wall biosynthesis
VAGGLPASRIVVKPHFVYDDPGVGRGEGGFALYVGRLSDEKGLGTLLAAWRTGPGLPPLRVVGDGPMANEVRAAARDGVLEWLGAAPPGEVSALMASAACLIFPSECYESFGRVVIESLAVGTPVVTSDGGAAAELVDPDRTGGHFRTGDPGDLAHQVRRLLGSAGGMDRLRAAARADYEARFSADANYQRLLAVYGEARARALEVPSREPRPAGHPGVV